MDIPAIEGGSEDDILGDTVGIFQKEGGAYLLDVTKRTYTTKKCPVRP